MLKPFDYDLDYDHLNLREHPELYRVGRGEQGVLLVEPYKSEILPHWRFKTPEIARESSEKIYSMFLEYKEKGDFVGMDMARKFLQMGYTRARRYTNHKGGRKYAEDGTILPYQNDKVKAESAAIFKAQWQVAKTDSEYVRMKEDHREKYERESLDESAQRVFCGLEAQCNESS
ncbi:hypothetical protein SY83_09645 [Paenibacillus swuensis]|uniref:Cytoplasmic protein n=1 Tax=Paenibacillus swuensis TaxID=1178515 RepID=A0A172TI12_9BACL|nr:DUF4385 domain-containing protein [Paenibacillus swuensis]ANE46497.1 hypothetical protein SY83_09645 [Paenibacillus swuensis]